MSHLHYQDDELWIENVSLTSIAERYQTPCYVYSRHCIEQNWQTFEKTLANIPHRLSYAVKANSNIAILNVLAQQGANFDIVSLGELERVIAAKGDPKKIIFSGIGKTAYEIEQAIQYGIHCFNVESMAELERLQSIAKQKNKVIPIALRINPDINPRTHAHISTGLKENKFGIDINEIIPLCQTLQNYTHLELIGIACHIGSQITELEPFLLAVDQLLGIYKELMQLSITLQHINMGGGLGITYHNETPPSIHDYTNALQKKLAGIPLELILEPGRAIIGNAGLLLTRVEYIKNTAHRNFAIVDAGMNDLLRPALYDAWQPIFSVVRRSIDTQTYDIVGPVCESADFLGKNRELAIQAGDLLAIDCAGAYGFSMSSNYNSRCRPAEIMIDDNQTHLIRKRETIASLFALESMLMHEGIKQ